MSQSRELQLHIAQMEEIRMILSAMKNLALIEVHKLARYQVLQGQAVTNIEHAGLDFLDHFPRFAATVDEPGKQLIILVGTERGFCGDFNERLLTVLDAQSYLGVIAIGSRLCSKLAERSYKALANLPGASVTEEVVRVIHGLLEILPGLTTDQPNQLGLCVYYHDNSYGELKRRQLLPPFPKPTRKPVYQARPMLYLKPKLFFSELVEHYLFAVLHEIFYVSLLAENQRRLQHLEGAVKHLDDETVSMRRKSQIFRQEEITEEIEVILLNTEKF